MSYEMKFNQLSEEEKLLNGREKLLKIAQSEVSTFFCHDLES